jgi:aerobic carbon-monoxide dehydrogenase small subunit
MVLRYQEGSVVLIRTTVDGVPHEDDVAPRLLLVHHLRGSLGRTGTVIGCDTSNCGACTVLQDGLSVKSCTVLAIQADGSDITTVQGLADGGLHREHARIVEQFAAAPGTGSSAD